MNLIKEIKNKRKPIYERWLISFILELKSSKTDKYIEYWNNKPYPILSYVGNDLWYDSIEIHNVLLKYKLSDLEIKSLVKKVAKQILKLEIEDVHRWS